MSTSADLLDCARAELGTEETPHGSNDVKYNSWYYGHEVVGTEFPWCAVFQSWLAAQAGATDIIPRHAYTPAGAGWFQQRGDWSRTPQVGSLVYYHWSSMARIGHVGIVEAVMADGSWVAIEGNTDAAGGRTGGRVMRQRRSGVGVLGGFGHPRYDRSTRLRAIPPTPAGPPFPGQILQLTSPLTTGSDVSTLQDRLNVHLSANAVPTLEVDGEFGDATDAGVRWYQRARTGEPFNLVLDGQVGRLTWESLWR